MTVTTMDAGRIEAGSTNFRRDRPDTFEMLVVHGAFRRGFARLPALARGVAAGDAARAAVVAQYYRDLAMFLHHHHSGEDALIWRKLMRRASLETELVLRMETQHERLAALLQTADVRADEEERYVLPLIEEHLTVAESPMITEPMLVG